MIFLKPNLNALPLVSREIRQEGLVQNWSSNFNCIGLIVGATGFGKTFVAIKAIIKLNKNSPSSTTNIIVPTKNLKEDWERKNTGHIDKFKLKNVKVWVINTYIKTTHTCDFLVLDEVHRIAATSFFKALRDTICKWKMGLTATIERLDGRHQEILKVLPLVDTVTMEECRREGWVSDFVVFNMPVSLDQNEVEMHEKQDKIFNTYFARFQNNFDLMMACSYGDHQKGTKKARLVKIKLDADGELYNGGYGEPIVHEGKPSKIKEWWAKKNGWDGKEEKSMWNPTSLSRYAGLAITAMKERKKLLSCSKAKEEVVKEICKYRTGKKLIFCESIEVADKLATELGGLAFHSETYVTKDGKLVKKGAKEWVLEQFYGNVDILIAVKALDEGFSMDSIDTIIMHSYDSSRIRNIQRTGRGLRLDANNEDKVAVIINLYTPDSQEEKWLREKQRGERTLIRKVESLEHFKMLCPMS